MFNSTVLDLAVGLIFCFLAVSLATGIVVEAISSIIKWRANTLRKGIGDLLNDTQFRGLARLLYDHGAINPRAPGAAAPQQDAAQPNAPPAATQQNAAQLEAPKAKTPQAASMRNIAEKIGEVFKQKPAYIDRQLFANALMDLTGISKQIAAAAEQAAPRPTLQSLHDAVATTFKKIPNPQLEQLLTGIIDRSFGDAEKLRTELSTWFDLAMDRVGGAYKRWTQLVSFVAALVLAVGLNIDAVAVAKALWVQPKLAEQLKAPTTPTTGGKAETNPDIARLLEQMNTTLPVGWPNGFGYQRYKDKSGQASCLSAGGWGIAFVGWLITAFSVLFGAPFWFDLLQTVIRLKGTGPSPQEKVDGRAAAS